MEGAGGRFPCRRPRLRGDRRWGKAPPLSDSISVTISSSASAIRLARARSPVQYTAFRRRSMSDTGRETVTRWADKEDSGRTGWCGPSGMGWLMGACVCGMLVRKHLSQRASASTAWRTPTTRSCATVSDRFATVCDTIPSTLLSGTQQLPYLSAPTRLTRE